MTPLQHITSLLTILRTIKRNILGQHLESEMKILGKFINPNSICFDVGAAEGRYTLLMSRLASKSRIFSFEPAKYQWHILVALIKIYYRLANVLLVNMALSKNIGTILFCTPRKKTNNFGYCLGYLLQSASNKKGDLIEKVKVTTIDEFCLKQEINRVDFIKCDVEGSELLVFEGAGKILLRDSPTILCEINPKFIERFGYTTGDIETFFQKKGYYIFILKEKLEMVSNIQESRNYFFIHPNRYTIN